MSKQLLYLLDKEYLHNNNLDQEDSSPTSETSSSHSNCDDELSLDDEGSEFSEFGNDYEEDNLDEDGVFEEYDEGEDQTDDDENEDETASGEGEASDESQADSENDDEKTTDDTDENNLDDLRFSKFFNATYGEYEMFNYIPDDKLISKAAISKVGLNELARRGSVGTNAIKEHVTGGAHADQIVASNIGIDANNISFQNEQIINGGQDVSNIEFEDFLEANYHNQAIEEEDHTQFADLDMDEQEINDIENLLENLAAEEAENEEDGDDTNFEDQDNLIDGSLDGFQINYGLDGEQMEQELESLEELPSNSCLSEGVSFGISMSNNSHDHDYQIYEDDEANNEAADDL